MGLLPHLYGKISSPQSLWYTWKSTVPIGTPAESSTMTGPKRLAARWQIQSIAWVTTVPFKFCTPCFVHFTDLQSWLHRLVPAAVWLWAYRSQQLHLHIPRHWREYVLCKPHCQPLAGQPVLHIWKGNCFKLYNFHCDLCFLFAFTCRVLVPFLLTGWRTVTTMVLLLLEWAVMDLVVQWIPWLPYLALQNIDCDVWWFPGTSDPSNPCYGYWDARNKTHNPVKFFGITSIGPATLDYTSYDVRPISVALDLPNNSSCFKKCKPPTNLWRKPKSGPKRLKMIHFPSCDWKLASSVL